MGGTAITAPPWPASSPNPHPRPDELWVVTLSRTGHQYHDYSQSPLKVPFLRTFSSLAPALMIIPCWGRGAILSSPGLQLPIWSHSQGLHPISNHFPKSLLRRFRAEATLTETPQTLALLQADTKQWLSLSENHHKADRPQTSPVYSLLLTLPCNFTSQKQNWQQEHFIY